MSLNVVNLSTCNYQRIASKKHALCPKAVPPSSRLPDLFLQVPHEFEVSTRSSDGVKKVVKTIDFHSYQDHAVPIAPAIP